VITVCLYLSMLPKVSVLRISIRFRSVSTWNSEYIVSQSLGKITEVGTQSP